MVEQEKSDMKYNMYSDSPIENASLFYFETYSDVISEIILNKENKTPFTIAINGEWGRGKTTLMKTIQTTLINSEKSKNDDNRKVKCVWFDAWKYSETDSMLAALVLEIFIEMERNGLINKLKSVLAGSDKKWNFIKVFADIVKILGAGIVPLPEFDKWLEDSAYKKHLSFYVHFHDYMETIIKTFVLDEKEDGGGKFSDEEGVLVIFIDDLDRCPPKKIAKVLETINLFFDQEGCFFVFGADISLISKAIDVEYKPIGFSGEDYIKKMVQLKFDLPAIGEVDIINFIKKELNFEDEFEPNFELIKEGLERNQREIKRYLNSLNLMRMVGKSISKEKYEEELIIKWNILNFISPDFIKEINDEQKIIIQMEEIAGMEKDRIEKYIELLDEPYKGLINNFKPVSYTHLTLPTTPYV